MNIACLLRKLVAAVLFVSVANHSDCGRAQDIDEISSDQALRLSANTLLTSSLPTVSIVSPSDVLAETSTPRTGSLSVQLSEAFTNAVTVGLTVSPETNAVNGAIILSTNRVVFAVGETQKTVYISARDGTDASWLNGFTITPTVIGNAAAQAYFTAMSEGYVEVMNVGPVITTPVSTDVTTDTYLYTIVQGDRFEFSWVVSDVAADLSTERVDWAFGDGNTATGHGRAGTVTNAFETAGAYVVRVTATDKDGGCSVAQFKVNVVAAKYVVVTPVGPNATATYYGAPGLGCGRILSTPARQPVVNRNNVYFFRYDPGVSSAILEALPYKAGSVVTNFDGTGAPVPGAVTAYDSFFYVWVGKDQGIVEASLNPATTSSAIAISLSEEARSVQAVFSREWRVADNMGDINQDGIPDKNAMSYNLPALVGSDGVKPCELTDAAGYNGDSDFLPLNPTGAGGVFDFRPVSGTDGANAFTALLEVRGFDPGLNKPGVSDTDGVVDEPYTDPTLEDSDGDGLTDGWEYYFWYNARFTGLTGVAYNSSDVTNGTPIISKTIQLAFLPSTVLGTQAGISAVASPARDIDNDGLTDYEEMLIGTNPIRWDTDSDGLGDKWETLHGLNPLNASDGGVSISPEAGTVTADSLEVRMASADGADIRYTLDGSEPTSASALYQTNSPIVLTQSTTVNAKVFRPSTAGSATATATYTLRVASPAFAPDSGSVFTNSLAVVLSCASDGAVIRYTLDGSEPIETSDEYASAIELTTSTTVKAKAFKPGFAESETVAAQYHSATEYFVDASRPDDSGDGQSWATAKKTIQAAMDLTSDGDTVFVTNGVYKVGGTVAPGAALFSRVVATNNVALRSINGAQATVIEGSGGEAYGTASAVRCVDMSNGILEGFTLQGGATRSAGPERDVCGGGVMTRGGSVRNCIVRNNHARRGGGLYGGVASDSLVYGNEAVEGAGFCEVSAYNSTVSGNSGPGVGGGSLFNSIVWSNAVPYDASSAPTSMVNCLAESWPAGEAYRNNISAAPRFVDAAAGDFRLQTNSPCLDVGDNAYVQGKVDVAGRPRIMNETVDLGACELSRVRVALNAGEGTVTPSSVLVTSGEAYGALPTPIRAEYTFNGWWSDAGEAGTRVQDSTVVATLDSHTLYAKWIFGLPPVLAKVSPAEGLITINEGASLALSVTANDGADQNAGKRGMSNVTWYVDGVLTQTAKTGAPNAITSTFTLKTNGATVKGAAYRDLVVRAVALDRQGDVSHAEWTVRVTNVPVAQTITFKALAEKALGDADFAPGAVSSSGLPVTCVSSDESVAVVVDGLVHIVGAGKTVITATQVGDFDYKAAAPVSQALTVKVRLTAIVSSGSGTVSGSGLYVPGTLVSLAAKPAKGSAFLHWDDGSQALTRRYLMPRSNATVAAWFGAVTNVPKPELTDPGVQRAMVGVPFRLPLSIASESLPAVTVSGLPTGLSYVPATRMIEGAPTVVVTNKAVTVKVTNASPLTESKTFAMTVEPLPAWAQGTFNGAASAEGLGSGSAALSVAKNGNISGKFTLRGTNFAFGLASYAGRDEAGTFWLTATAKVAKAALPLTLSVARPEVTDTTGTVPDTLSKASGMLGGGGGVALYRSVWKDSAALSAAAAAYAGYYTASLPGGEAFGSGYLLLTLDAAGGVKAAGKLADGAVVSLGGTLTLDEAGRVFAVLYTAPTAYKGGGLFGVAEFVKRDGTSRVYLRCTGEEQFAWENLNPQATPLYGAGFSRNLGLVGGWYDKLGNLYGYYRDRVISIDTDGSPAPTLAAGTNRIESAWWDPDGIVIAAVTNRQGVLTGLQAPRAGAPVKETGNTYDYESSTNTVGLTLSLTRATGVIKGTFKAWFDTATTHTSKPLSYEGVLTPERENMADGVAGRGYILWPSTGTYTTPQNRTASYSFNWSYDLRLFLSNPIE